MQDIEKAPKDGTHIIGYGTHENDCGDHELGFCEIYWVDRCWYNITHYPSDPVAWMPLPESGKFK